jgi:ABC-type phosphate transport system substrate-binding protein
VCLLRESYDSILRRKIDMKNFKLFALPSCLAAALLLASTCYGQAPQLVGAGSSALFNTTAVAAVNSNPITGAGAPCGTFIWTSKTSGSNYAAGSDGRPGVPLEPGNIWIAWDNSTTPTTVCAYLSVDSVVGQRLFFATSSNGNGGTMRGTISLSGSAVGAAGNNAVPYLTDTALPAAVYALVSGAQLNAAFTDIRPEDGLYATLRAQCTRNAGLSCLGYGPAGIGTPVQSAFSATSAQVISYAESGTDPLTGLTVQTATTIPIGADPIIIFANTSATANPGDFGNLNPTNANSHTLAAVFSGLLTRTTDITGGPFTTAGSPLAVIFREPTSGTYNTFEWQIVRAKGTVLAQETGINPTTSCSFTYPSPETYVVPATSCVNPANVFAADGASRSRAIGTGELVSAVNANANAIGYAFWGFSTFNPSKYTHIKYLALDGVDPLFANYSGVTPTCTGTAPSITCSTSVTFPNIQGGNYRSWSLLRMLIPSNVTYSGSFYQTFIQDAQDQAASKIADFVPFLVSTAGGAINGNLKVFRSHYALTSVGIGASPLNGTNQSPIGPYPAYYEQGGDMAGAVFQVQNDIDYSADNGAGVQLTGYIQ